MAGTVELEIVYAPSPDVVAREIEGELILVPLTAGIGDAEDGLFSLNETGRVIWEKLGETKSLNTIIEALTVEYEASAAEIECDVLGLVEELLNRGLVVEIPNE